MDRETIPDIDTMTIEHLDFEVMCESPWHDPNNPARKYVGAPKPAEFMASFTCPECKGSREIMVCKPCMTVWIVSPLIGCNSCFKAAPGTEWNLKFTPIK